MKILTYCGVVLLLILISFPITAEAFSRRTHSSEVAQNSITVPVDRQTISPQAVPEPPALLLMGVGIGLFAIYSMTKWFRGQDASREKEL
jgi:hypothetical protein